MYGIMDGCMGGWMDSWVMDGQARGDDLGALWMMKDYATQESLSTVRGSDLAPTNRGQEVDLHGICGSFGASPHLVRHPSPPTMLQHLSVSPLPQQFSCRGSPQR